MFLNIMCNNNNHNIMCKTWMLLIEGHLLTLLCFCKKNYFQHCNKNYLVCIYSKLYSRKADIVI